VKDYIFVFKVHQAAHGVVTNYRRIGSGRHRVTKGLFTRTIKTLLHDVARCRAMSHDVAQCHTMSHDVARCCTMSHDVARCCTMLHDVARCCTMSHNVARCCAMSHDVAQCCTMSHNVAQCRATPSDKRNVAQQGFHCLCKYPLYNP
jgi:2-C-methyl-D-erythritol 4-phosphate cytidylyltransferase